MLSFPINQKSCLVLFIINKYQFLTPNLLLLTLLKIERYFKYKITYYTTALLFLKTKRVQGCIGIVYEDQKCLHDTINYWQTV